MASRNILLGLKNAKPRSATIKSPSSIGQTVAGSSTKPSASAITSLKRKLNDEKAIGKTLASPKKLRGSPSKEKPERAELRQVIKAGVDFGTTYSGVAFVCTIDQHGDVQVLNEYSGGQMQSDVLEKVPTRFAYDSENDGKTAWGYRVKPGMVSYSWFKLLLDEETDVAEYDDPLLRQSAAMGMNKLPRGKTAKDVTADFLRCLHEHVMAKLANHLTQAMLDETPIHFYFTLPATWSPKARYLTREAAEMAGFGGRAGDKLFMIDEPEAAAIAALKTTIDAFPEGNHFKVGQGIVVADIGGGTADLVSYKIISLSPLELEEICIGVGAKCGGTSADRALHELMGKRYGTAFTSQPMSKIGPGSKFMDQFERIKRDFNGEDMDAQFELHLKMSGMDGDVEGYDFETDEIILTANDLVKIMETVVTPSIGLVKEQLVLIQKRKKTMAVHKLVLVGGMGSSPYMVERFEAFCKDELKGKITLVTSMKAWSAVCRGAAHRGLEDSPVLTRRSRCNYGFLVHMDFEEGKHLEEDAFEDELNGKRAKDQMIWPTRKNTPVKPGQRKVTVCYYTIPASTVTFTPRIVLYKCAEDNPPTRKDDSVSKVATIKTDLTKLVRSQRKKLIKKGTITDEGSFELVVRLHLKLGSEKGVLEAHATSMAKTVGETKINYEGNTLWEREGVEDVKSEF